MAFDTAIQEPGRVLIVDDHEVMRDILSRNVESQGHHVLLAADGLEALQILSTEHVELVLLDMMMPGMTGEEVLVRAKSDPAIRDIPILMVSADSDTDRIAGCISKGAEDYLVKPFNPVFLRTRINTSLQKHRLLLRERSYQRLLEEQVAERTQLAEQRAAALERSEAALRSQSHILQSILSSMGDGVVVVDKDRNLLHINPAAQRMLGDVAADLLGALESLPSQLLLADTMAPCPLNELPIVRALNGQAVDGMELFLQGEPGVPDRWLSVTARPLQGSEQGQERTIGGAVSVVRDISATKSAELALRESEERYALAARGANDGLWDWNLRSSQVYYSPRWKAMLGYEEQEIDATIDGWFDRVHPDDREPLQARLAAHHRNLITHFEHEYRIRHKDGAFRWMLCRGLAVWDTNGRVIRMAGSQTDISPRKQIERQLIHDALHDALTALPNRTLFIDRLQHAINRRRRNPAYLFAVMFLDLDRFKVINDSLGHAVGDRLLIAIASRLEGCVRAGDTVARLGGDEFTLLIEDVQDIEMVTELAQRIQEALSAPLQLGEHEAFTTVSIGMVISTDDYAFATDMIRDADTAMYSAKMAGKARAVLFDPMMHVQAMSQLRLEADLRWAVDRGELRVHYQPIVSLEDGGLVGVEALVRWEHPQRGLLYPDSFLTIAEETGLIVPISWWTFHIACTQLSAWHHSIPSAANLWVSINLSARQLAEPNAVTKIRHILQETGLHPRHVKLEITEHTLIEYGEATAQTFTELRALGLQLCIDDFGIGYSSLSYLQRFPVDVLKIDRSFIHGIGEQGERSEIVHTIISLAHTLGLQAVAEGTETVQQMNALRRLACQYGQGWLFAKALDAETVEAFVRDEHRFF
jgi:diguanylate cyclase (GGDEF)-like protein/PAS domain S-box-containing protein